MTDTRARARVGFVWLEQLWQDVKYGCRMLVGSPVFTIVSVLSLAVGIGANCAIFSFADALLLRPLSVARPGEIMTVGSTASFEALSASALVASYPEYIDIRDHSKSFEGLGAFTYVTAGFTTDFKAPPKLKMGMLVSDNLFSVMAVEPTLGRSFTPEEHRVAGRDAVVILSRTLWTQEFGSDPAVLGRTVGINGHDFTVIGVTPPSFTGLNQYVRSDFFVPLMMSSRLLADARTGSLQARDARNLTLKGRLKAGVSQAQAQTELSAIATNLQREHPHTTKNRGLAIRTELQARMAQSPPDSMLIAMLSALALAVLLVACANVAGLLTSRAPVRAREMALRLAVGAKRSRLVAQLVTESLLVSLLGGVLGLAIGYAGITLFRRIQLPTDLPIILSFEMDRRALVFSLIVSVVSAMLFGLVPAIQATRTDLTALMKAGDAVAPKRRRRWGRAILVGGQVAVSVVLLVIATFMYRGFSAQLAGGPGFRIDRLLMMGFDTTLTRYSESRSEQFFQQLVERTRAVPSVVNVTLTTAIPMASDSLEFVTIAPEGFQFPQGKENVTVLSSRIDERYFDTFAIPIIQGRNFTVEDDLEAPRVAIVNQQLARHYWPNEDAIGKRFQLNDTDKTWIQIVGVARTAKYLFIAEPPTDFVYLPYRQRIPQRMIMVTQSAGDAGALVGPLRDVVRGLDANQPIFNVRTMEEFYRMRAVAVFNVLITVIGAMGLMGLGLAIVGLYGLVAYAAARRTREIGIRMAIGASRDTVLRLVLRQGMVLALVGLAIGLVASVGAGRLLAAAFPSGDEPPTDVLPFFIVTPVVLAVTFLATYIPAMRAAAINPVQALRQE
jgi:macrolide transport system ATP-binding/permease protein